MEVFVLGCGGSLPLPYRHLTSVLLRYQGESFLFDCGEGSQVALKKTDLRWKNITAVLISHTHADHVTGLPGLLMLSSQVERSKPLKIFGPEKIADYVASNRSSLEMYLNYPINIIQLANKPSSQLLIDSDDYRICSFPVHHTRTCVGYYFEEKPRSGRFAPEKAQQLAIPRGPLWGQLQQGKEIILADGRRIQPSQVVGPNRPGRKVTFLTDSVYHPDLLGPIANSDLLICEGMFTQDLAETAREKGHMTAAQAARLARDAGGVKQLGLIHFSPRYTNLQLEQLLREAREIFPPSLLCRDRLRIDVTPLEE